MCPKCKGSKKNSLTQFIIIVTLLLCASLFASGNHDHSNKKNGDKMDHSKMDHSKMKKSTRKQLSEIEKKSVLSMFKENESLHKAFFKYDGKLAEKNAGKLIKAIDSLESKEVAKLLSYSKKLLLNIKSSNKRDVNNKNYHLVSMVLIKIVNTYDLGNIYNAYSCPMAFDNDKKGEWVQNSLKMAKVHNPYKSDMLHCGSQDTKY
jgi:hypothetical protein